jgi:hypothetical protein
MRTVFAKIVIRLFLWKPGGAVALPSFVTKSSRQGPVFAILLHDQAIYQEAPFQPEGGGGN